MPVESTDHVLVERAGVPYRTTAGDIAALGGGGGGTLAQIEPLPAIRAAAGWWVAPVGQTPSGTFSTAANTLYSVPFGNAHLIDAIAVNVSTLAAGSLGRIGIYTTDDNGLPTTLLYASGELDFSTTGSKLFTLGTSFRVSRLVWFVLQTNATPCTFTAGTVANGNGIAGLLGRNAQTSQVTSGLFNQTRTYAALPSTHPALVTHSATTNPPLISARLA